MARRSGDGGHASATSRGDDLPPPPLPAHAGDAGRDGAAPTTPGGRGRGRGGGDGGDRDDDDGDGGDGAPKKRGKLVLVVAGALIAGLLIASMVLLGRSNAGRYFLRCGADHISAERGRSFPPWGSRPLGGPQWKAIKIPPDAECQSRETADLAELEGWYLDALVAQAQAKLTAKEVTAVDQAQQELEQALLLARDPERRDQRKEVDRLLGDVEYWRGRARVRAAIDTLEEAGARYDAAADKRPRHASDAAAWAGWVRHVARELAAGPGGTVAEPATGDGGAAPPHPEVPTGVALPVEEPSTAPAEPAPDAGVPPSLPRGGVLL
ncbi:MAG: hypothetical protein H6709_12775 [Kofleriaceae bacterium]|nr:hypothetical protein [Kofleriaceae bacterium]